MSTNHSRDSSNDTGYQLILEHILSYPGTYELPLRTMYTLNSTPRAQQSGPPKSSQEQHSPLPSPPSPSPQEATQEATAQFASALINQISQLPSQPCSLPPIFITSFLRRCFSEDLLMVDFPQALTGLDYLKDLEARRRRESAAALRRLGIDKTALKIGNHELSKNYPGVAARLTTTEANERKVDALYTQLYVALRRWILINELSLTPFNNHNCLAMLNTLYPPITAPSSTPAPTTQLTPQVLKDQRHGFFKYIQSVARSGPCVLENLMQHGKKHPGDANGWPAVRDTLDAYLRVANRLIEDSAKVAGWEDFEERAGKRKTDSGVSFGSGGTTARETSGSGGGSGAGGGAQVGVADRNKPLPGTPGGAVTPGKGLSALERIAREIRRIKTRSRVVGEGSEQEEEKEDETRPGTEEEGHGKTGVKRSKSGGGKVVMKMRSLGDVRSASRYGGGGGAGEFDREEMKRQRLLYDAKSSRGRAMAMGGGRGLYVA